MIDSGDIAETRARLGARIRDLRRGRGLSQASLALMVGIDRTYLVGVEKGRRNVSVDNLSKISRGLGVTLSELFAGVDAPVSPRNRFEVVEEHLSTVRA